MPAAQHPKRLRVAVTGATGNIGRVTLPRLLANDRIGRVVALDVGQPELSHAKLELVRLDLSRARVAEELGATLRTLGTDTVVHLAFFSSPVRDSAFAHEVEAIGTGHVLAACAAAGVKAFVMSSTTLVYGASAQSPNFLTEDRPLPAHSHSRWVGDKIEAEQQVRLYRRSHAGLRSIVLRFAPLVGPTVDTPITRYLGRCAAPVALGHDPLVQCVHEEDAAEALLLAVLSTRNGDYNICGRGVVPLSTALRLAGSRPLPLPLPFASASLHALNAVGITAVPTRMLDYLRYLWVADGTKAEHELGFKPRFGTREALLSFAKARGRAAAA